MKKLILILSLLFSLFMSMSVFAADYSIGSASWDVGSKALATWDETRTRQSTKYSCTRATKKSAQTMLQVPRNMILQNLS